MLTLAGYDANAGRVDPSEYQSLLTQAGEKQYVRVQVNLDVDATLEIIAKRPSSFVAKVAAKEQAILVELEGTILPSSIWRSGLGQIGVYASPQAMAKLAISANVQSFSRDFTGEQRSGIHDATGQIAKIEAEIERNGYATVEVAQNIDNFEFDLGADAKVNHRSTAAQQAELNVKRNSFLNSLPSASFPDLARVQANAAMAVGSVNSSPVHFLRVGKDGLYLLKEHADVRSVRLAGGLDTEPVRLEPDALALARQQGHAEVLVDLQRFAGYSPLKGKLSKAAWKAQDDGIQRAFKEIVGALEPQAIQTIRKFDGLATIQVTLALASMERLYQRPDARILGVSLNKPAAMTALAESTVQMALPLAWNASLKGKGQYIAILDTGVKADHPFFRDASGKSRVVLEGCFGSTVKMNWTGEQVGDWKPLCDNPDANGNSVGPGTAKPYTEALYTNFDHGTHVAGIAAGRQVAGAAPGTDGGTNGVAPDANIIAVQVFSQPIGGPGQTTTLSVDIAEALSVLDTLGSSEITINMSIAKGNKYTSPDSNCLNYNTLVRDKIALMTSKRMPIVVAAGNEGWKDGIGWPACLPGVIKAGAILDTGATDFNATIWDGSNLADPLGFPNDPFFLAPGTLIRSAVPDGRLYSGMGGTSMATPHIAGVYALLKQAVPNLAVADATAWITAHATLPVTAQVGLFPPLRTVTLRRIKLRL